ncbi:surface-adhesin E family protein [Geobacter anodireducens]|uniref:Surface-adhesin protein E-like domain-containing protein n=1 Tax=Geobacter anodireducens TaxID=1340425 RepID=A0ABR9NVR6_9BACT|nr:surface-adhesin E family protein [Geobacter anodireducens]MBE2888364.1 hypothetical protein [Geobacter anodireducens]HMN03847.1 hypothetical protein [Geobacter anodireducens]
MTITGRLLSAVAALALTAGSVLAAEWVVLDEDPMLSTFYYDSSSVSRDKEGMVSVWTRAIYSEEGKADALDTMGNPPAFKDLSHTHFLYTIDCQAAKSRLEKVIHFDDKAEPIKEYNLSGKTDWEAIDEFTRLGLLQEAVCR